MTNSLLDIYTDYLSVSFGAATATGLSGLLDGAISHDAVTRFLSQPEFTSKDLWKQVKSTVREIESEKGVLIFDDTVQEKPWMDENDLICWVLADIWFASAENMSHIKPVRGKNFIMAMKCNRLVALSKVDHQKKRYTRLDQLEWPEAGVVTGWLKGMNFPVRLARQVFKNKDGSTGTLYLVCSQLDASWDTITTTYQKRWNVEVFHQSLKSNAAFAKSPARTPTTQSNHLFASIVAVFKMEKLKMKTKLNHFALKAKLYAKAIKIAFEELHLMRAA